jgi:eukaryotic-like serine/threonine-protein kinase
MIGQTISHYRILEKLGGGGMGVVYKAEDTQLKRTVALKFLPPSLTLDSEAQTRFVHEARAASALDHSNICTIHEIGQTDDGQLFIVMACYEGQTLKKRIEDGRLNIEDGLDLAIQVASGLARSHEVGIVHRDIKPANIMLTTHGEAKILDFGLAKLGGGSMLTRTGTTLGTAAYMSPEQARGDQVDQRTDIWSLGAVLYEMLTGQRAFQSDYEQALVYAILNEDPKPVRLLRPEVPEVVEHIVQKAMAKGKEERYKRTEDLLSDLKAARGGVEQSGVTIAAVEMMERRRKKKRMRMLMAAGIALLVLAGVVFVGLPLMQDQALASNPKAIAFVNFENKTGDESLSYLQEVIPSLLSTSLEDSKYVRIIGQDRIRSLVKQFKKDTIKVIDRDTWLFLFRKAGVDVMGAGSFTKGGPLFLTEIQLIDVNSGLPLGASLKARGQEVASFLQEDGIVNDLAHQISRGLGVSRMSTRASVSPVAEVSSTSMDAQRYYQRGVLEANRFNHKDARVFFELAVKDDSTFAIAWYKLGMECGMMGDGPFADSAFAHVAKNVSRATEREQFEIASSDSNLRVSLLEARGRKDAGRDWLPFFKARTEIFPFDIGFHLAYAQTLRDRGPLSEAIREFERVLQLDPANALAYNEIGYTYALDEQVEKATWAFERYIEMQPGDPNPFHSSAEFFLMFGRFSEGIAKCERALQVKPDFYLAPLTLAKLHFMNENYDEAVRWALRASEISPTPSLRAEYLWWRAWYLVWAGRLKEAGEALRRSEQLASPVYDNNVLAFISWLRGWCAYEQGDWKRARMHLAAWARRSSPQRGITWFYPQFCLGLLDLQQGITDSIDSRLQRMKDTIMASVARNPVSAPYIEPFLRYHVIALEGAYILAVHRPEEVQPKWIPARWAIKNPDSIATASWPIQYPFAWGRGSATERLWIPIPFDILPRAYVERGMIDSAIASYELALKKPPHLMGPIIPRYYYRLARLYEQKGNKDKAIENYTQFLKVWGKADPIYKEPADARARLAKLKGVRL